MGNVLCRHCFHLFPDREMAVLCTSRECAAVRDERGRPGPRFLVPRHSPGLWSRLRRRPELAAPCPVCRRVGRLVPACPICRRELPRTADDGAGDDRIIAVIGAKNAGKSHYLAALFHQFLKASVGGERWQADSDPASEREIESRYWRPLFEEMRELDESPLEPGPEMRLTLVDRRDGRRVLLAFRDLSGENFSRPRRLEEVEFLRYAHGVVLLADPQVFAAAAAGGGDPGAAAYPDFLEVLDTYRAALASQPRYGDRAEELLPLLPEQKLLAVAVSKADLVLPRRHRFWNPGETNGYLEPGFWEGRAEASRSAESWLAERLGGRLEDAASGFADVSYFFISNFGYKHRPHSERLRKPPRPLRVHEPICALLDRFAGTSGASSAGGVSGGGEPVPARLEEL